MCPVHKSNEGRHFTVAKQSIEAPKHPETHFCDLVLAMVPSSQISPLRQARLALVMLLKCCGSSCSTASGSGQGGLPTGIAPEATTSKASLGLTLSVSGALAASKLS